MNFSEMDQHDFKHWVYINVPVYTEAEMADYRARVAELEVGIANAQGQIFRLINSQREVMGKAVEDVLITALTSLTKRVEA